MILLRRERLGTYLAWILFAAAFYWGSASAFKRSENGHSGPDGLLDTHHSFLALPVVRENNKPLTKLKTSGRGCVPVQTLFLENRNLNFIEFHTSQSRIISVI